MKKIIAIGLAVLMTAAMMVGCKNTKNNDTSKTDEANIKITKAEDLKGLTIGVQAGTTGETYVNENFVKKNDNETKTTVMSFKTGMDAALDLKNGGIDAIVLDALPANSIVEKNPDLKIVDLGLEKEEYAIAVKKGNTELLKSINSTIKRMKDDGTYDSLTDAFMPADGNITIPESPLSSGSKKLIMGTNAAFPPFEYLNKSEIVGFDISMSEQIAYDSDSKLEVSDMAFDALIPALSSGQIDFIAAGMTVNPERLENVDFSDPYYASSQVVILKK